VGQDHGVDPVGLGQAADGAGEIAGLPRVDDGDGQTGDLQRRGQRHLVAAGRLPDEESGLERGQPADEGGDALGVIGVGEGTAVGTEGGVQAGLGYVNAEEQG
jgi:hypothetical protein